MWGQGLQKHLQEWALCVGLAFKGPVIFRMPWLVTVAQCNAHCLFFSVKKFSPWYSVGTQLVPTEYHVSSWGGEILVQKGALQLHYKKNLILALCVHYNGHGSSFFFRIRTQKIIGLDGGHALKDGDDIHAIHPGLLLETWLD